MRNIRVIVALFVFAFFILSSVFAVGSSQIRVFFPNGGETFFFGQAFHVGWRSSEEARNTIVSISLRNSDGEMFFLKEAETRPGGLLNFVKIIVWEKYYSPDGQYSIRIDTDNPYCMGDGSDGFFTIKHGKHSIGSVRGFKNPYVFEARDCTTATIKYHNQVAIRDFWEVDVVTFPELEKGEVSLSKTNNLIKISSKMVYSLVIKIKFINGLVTPVELTFRTDGRGGGIFAIDAIGEMKKIESLPPVEGFKGSPDSPTTWGRLKL